MKDPSKQAIASPGQKNAIALIFSSKCIQPTQHAQLPTGTARHPPRLLPSPASTARDGHRPLQVLPFGSLHQGGELPLSAHNKPRQKLLRRQELCGTSVCAASAHRRRGTLHPLTLPPGRNRPSHPIQRPGRGPRARPAHAHQIPHILRA